MDLDALLLFHAVAAHGGFGRAARATKRAKTTLSRRVADLEAQLGARLFERGSATLRLTEEGRALLASTREPLDELAAAEGAIKGGGDEPRGRLRVSVPLTFAQHLMGEFAARFLERHPRVRLEVVADDRYVDLVQEGFDVAIRGQPKANDELVGRCVLRDRFWVVAAPSCPRPEPGENGAPVRVPAVVRALGDDPRPWVFEGGDGVVMVPEPVLRLSTLAIRDAVRAGAGAAKFPSYFVRKDVAEGVLVRWGVLTEEPLEFWVLHASSRLASRKVRAFVDMASEFFSNASR